MSSGCNTGNSETADSCASLGEPALAEVIFECVSDIAGVAESSEAALNFLLVAGPRGHHHHPADNGFPAGLGRCFFLPCGASRRSRDEKLSIETKFRT
jgi:hypothetical protein